jgi:hypothetical protein
MPLIEANVLDVLKACEVDQAAQTIKIVAQLDRSVYEGTNEVLTRLGGKWNKSTGAHVFPYDPSTLLQAVLDTREMPPKNPTAFFPTPKSVRHLILDTIVVPHCARVLEPSAGTGALADMIRSNSTGATIDVCEVLPINQSVLKAKGYNVVADDFMSYETTRKYNMVIMNPPFSLDGDQSAYITHFMHAWNNMLSLFGEIVCIVPTSWMHRTDKRSTEFREFVMEWLDYVPIEAGAFKESGTMVPTMMLTGQKTEVPWKRQHKGAWSGYASWHAWQFALYVDNDAKSQHQAYSIKTVEQFRPFALDMASKMVKEMEMSLRLDDNDIQELFNYYQGR